MTPCPVCGWVPGKGLSALARYWHIRLAHPEEYGAIFLRENRETAKALIAGAIKTRQKAKRVGKDAAVAPDVAAPYWWEGMDAEDVAP